MQPLEVKGLAWSFTVRLETEPEALRAIRRLVAAVVRQAGGSDDAAQEVEVALGEALTNARNHAYGGGVGPLEIDITRDEQHLTLLIHDHGKPVANPLTVPEVLPKQEGGRGLFLMRQMMDEVEIVSSAGTSVRMTKRLH